MLPIQTAALNRPTTAARPARAGSTSGAAFMLPQQAGVAPAPMGMLSGTVQLSGIMFLQEATFVEDALERKKRKAKQGQDVLKTLEDVQRGLITGEINNQQLTTLKSQLDDLTHEGLTDDPHLAQILGEIEVRAAVELAKRGMV